MPNANRLLPPAATVSTSPEVGYARDGVRLLFEKGPIGNDARLVSVTRGTKKPATFTCGRPVATVAPFGVIDEKLIGVWAVSDGSKSWRTAWKVDRSTTRSWSPS